MLPGKKLTPRQVLRTVLDDEDEENDQDSQAFIVNDENDPLFVQQPHFRLPSPREGSSKFATRNFPFCQLSDSVDDGPPLTSSVTQCTPVAKAAAIIPFRHLNKAFTTAEVLEQANERLRYWVG